MQLKVTYSTKSLSKEVLINWLFMVKVLDVGDSL